MDAVKFKLKRGPHKSTTVSPVRKHRFKDQFARDHVYKDCGKLTEDDLIDIAFLAAQGESDAQIAARYNFRNASTTWRVRHDHQMYEVDLIDKIDADD